MNEQNTINIEGLDPKSRDWQQLPDNPEISVCFGEPSKLSVSLMLKTPKSFCILRLWFTGEREFIYVGKGQSDLRLGDEETYNFVWRCEICEMQQPRGGKGFPLVNAPDELKFAKICSNCVPLFEQASREAQEERLKNMPPIEPLEPSSAFVEELVEAPRKRRK